MLLKKFRIVNRNVFVRISYFGGSICNAYCDMSWKCTGDIKAACNKIYSQYAMEKCQINSYCYIFKFIQYDL